MRAGVTADGRWFVDAAGDVFATRCTCDAHRGQRRPHLARPIGNVHRDAELRARLAGTFQ